jgi:predicted CXXCH cytochrome family protein
MLPLGLLLLLPAGSGQNAAPQDGCVVCHGEAGQHLLRSVHTQAGVTCVDCHGGASGPLDPGDPHGPDLRPLTDPRAAVESCGSCHADIERMRPYGRRTDQLALYRTSRHGIRLAEGNTDVATCVSCHGAHEVLTATDPRSPVFRLNQVATCGGCHADQELMARYDLPGSAPAEYRGSAHGRALLELGRSSSPTCSSCHGSHGALPPRVQALGQVCGACHGVVREHFEAGPHMAAVRAGQMTECISCHGHHGVQVPSPELLTGAGEGHCGSCHTAADDPALAVARDLRAGLADIDTMLDDTARELEQAAARGLFIDREAGYLEEARGLRIQAGALVHAVSPDALRGLQDRCRGTIRQTAESLRKQERGLRDRRVFVTVFLLVVLLLAAVLMVYRREIGGGWGTRPPDAPGSGARPRAPAAEAGPDA